MSLEDVISALEAADQRLVLPQGFTDPHSYRGYYEQLAFEPAQNVTVAAMLADARSALGSTFEGYKGGSYEMDGFTECWIASYGCCSEDMIGPLLIGHMIAAGKLPDGLPEVDASDVMIPAEEAELVAAVSGGHPADYVEVTRPEPAFNVPAADHLEELDDNPGAACYHAFIDLDPQRGEVFTDLTGQSFVVAEGDTGPHLFSLRSGSRYNFMAVMSIGLLTRARIVPADSSAPMPGDLIDDGGDRWVPLGDGRYGMVDVVRSREEIKASFGIQKEGAPVRIVPADAIVLEQPTAGATRDLVTVMPGYGPSAPPVMVLIDGVRRVLLATGCRNCDGTPDASLTRDQARTLAAHIALAADDAEKNATP